MMQLFQHNMPIFRSVSAIVLLMAYLLSWGLVSNHSWLHVHNHLSHESVHSHDHDHTHDHQTEVSCDNQDPCHLRIYHHLSVGACQHDAHWVPELEHCELCDCLLSVTEFQEFASIQIQHKQVGVLTPVLVNRLVPVFGLDAHPLRGPPVSV